jgi:hypothetical protein
MAGITNYEIFAADDTYVLSQGFLPETVTSAKPHQRALQPF